MSVRKDAFHADAVVALDPVDEVVSLGEKEFRVADENIHRRIDARRNVNQHQALGAKRGGHGDVILESREGPAQGFLGLPLLGQRLYVFQCVFHSDRSSVSAAAGNCAGQEIKIFGRRSGHENCSRNDA